MKVRLHDEFLKGRLEQAGLRDFPEFFDIDDEHLAWVVPILGDQAPDTPEDVKAASAIAHYLWTKFPEFRNPVTERAPSQASGEDKLLQSVSDLKVPLWSAVSKLESSLGLLRQGVESVSDSIDKGIVDTCLAKVASSAVCARALEGIETRTGELSERVHEIPPSVHDLEQGLAQAISGSSEVVVSSIGSLRTEISANVRALAVGEHESASIVNGTLKECSKHLDSLHKRLESFGVREEEFFQSLKRSGRVAFRLALVVLSLLALALLLSVKQAFGQWSQISVITFKDSGGAVVKAYASPFTIKCNTNLTCSSSGSTLTMNAGAGGSTAWDAIGPPTVSDLSLSMAAWKTTFTWGNTTSTNNLFNLTDTASNTGTGYLFSLNTAASSTLKPFRICYRGTTDCVTFDTTVLQATGAATIVANSATTATTATTANAGDSATAFFPSGTLELAILPFGTANQILGANAGGTAIEHKTLSTGTTGTDFAIAHAANAVAFNLPSASGTVRGALTSANWTTFNDSVDSVSGTANQIGSTSGQTPVLSLADPLTLPGNFSGTQKANGDIFQSVKRFTDTTPTGYFQRFFKADGTTQLFAVAIDGTISSGSSTEAGSATYGGAGSTTASSVTIFGGDAAANAEAPYLRAVPSPVATGDDSYLFPCSTGGEFGISTSAPSANCTTAQTIERQGRKDAASGYAGLTASTKLNVAQGQEVWAVTDLTSYASTSGTGTQAILATITTPATNDALTWNGTNWINQAPGGSSHNFLSATHTDTVAGASVLGGMVYANATPAWQQLAGNITTTKKFLNQTGNATISAAPQWDAIADADLPATIARDAEITLTNLLGGTAGANSYDFEGGSVTRPFRRLAFASFPGTCTINREFLERSDPAVAGQVVYVCNAAGTGWDLVGDGGAGGSGDNITVNASAAVDADFDDATPAVPANALNVKWQKDASSPANISAYVPWAQGTITASTPIVNHTATWNSAGVTFVNMFSNVTDTLSAAASLLLDLQVGAASKFKVDKAGKVTLGGTGPSLFELAVGTAPGTPAAGITNVYSDTTDKNLKAKDDAGVVSGTVKADTGAANNFLTAISSAGVISKAQPALTNLSAGTSADLRGVLSDETGTGVAVFNDPQAMTLNVESGTNSITTASKIWIDAAACVAGTAATNWDMPDGAGDAQPTAACNDTGTIQRPTLSFSGSAVNGIERNFKLPSDWTGNIDLDIHYLSTVASPTGNVEWEIQTICRAVGETWDAAFNAAQTITDAQAAQNVINSAVQAALTTTTCAASEDFSIRIWRDGTNDTSNDVALMLGAELTIRRAQ